MAKNVLVAGAKNRPPMLEKGCYDIWKSRILLYIEVETKLLQELKDLTPEEKIRKSCDIKSTNIILLGLPIDIYTLVNHHKITRDIWNREEQRDFLANRLEEFDSDCDDLQLHTTLIFKAEHVDAFDSDYDEAPVGT
ncbi:hypothetical protein Tco_0344318 [Tanacetum coccineum]